MSERTRILRAIAQVEPVTDPADLLAPGGTDLHGVVHILFMLRRAGLVTFKERRPTITWQRAHGGSGVNGGKAPSGIKLTTRGRQVVAQERGEDR